MKEDVKRIFFTNIYMPRRATSGFAEWQKFGMIGQLWLVFPETTSAEGVAGIGEGRGWIAARFGSKPPRGTSRIGRRAISFADCRYRQPLPKYLIPKRLELSMDYKPIYYFPVPARVSRGGSHENTTCRLLPSSLLEGSRGRISFRDGDCRLSGTPLLSSTNVMTLFTFNIFPGLYLESKTKVY